MKVIVHDNAPTDADGKKLPPADVEMHAVDANEAVAADPKRYSIIDRKKVVTYLSTEDRVSAIEARLDRIDPPAKPAPMKATTPIPPDHSPRPEPAHQSPPTPAPKSEVPRKPGSESTSKPGDK